MKSKESAGSPPLSKMKVGVIIHAHFLDPEAWRYVMWGKPHESNFGVIPTGLKIAYEMAACRIYLCQGQMEQDPDRLRSPDALKYAMERIDRLPAEHASLLGIDGLVITYDDARTTRAELEWAGPIIAADGIDSVVCVTAPKHIFRAHQEALRAQRLGLFGKHVTVFAAPSQNDFPRTSSDDVCIFEPAHRAGLPHWNLHKYGHALVWVMRNRPEMILEDVLRQAGDTLANAGANVDWHPRD